MSTLPEENQVQSFDIDLVKKYPRSNRRLNMDISPYTIGSDENALEAASTLHISPYGIEFRTSEHYEKGSLLKIHLAIPDYWNRKQRFVEYGRVDEPGRCKILVKVVASEDVGRRGKKRAVVCRTVNMDQVDEQVLKSFLQEG